MDLDNGSSIYEMVLQIVLDLRRVQLSNVNRVFTVGITAAASLQCLA